MITRRFPSCTPWGLRICRCLVVVVVVAAGGRRKNANRALPLFTGDKEKKECFKKKETVLERERERVCVCVCVWVSSGLWTAHFKIFPHILVGCVCHPEQRTRAAGGGLQAVHLYGNETKCGHTHTHTHTRRQFCSPTTLLGTKRPVCRCSAAGHSCWAGTELCGQGQGLPLLLLLLPLLLLLLLLMTHSSHSMMGENHPPSEGEAAGMILSRVTAARIRFDIQTHLQLISPNFAPVCFPKKKKVPTLRLSLSPSDTRRDDICCVWMCHMALSYCSVVDKQQPHPLRSVGGCAAPRRESRLWWQSHGVLSPAAYIRREGYRLQVAAILWVSECPPLPPCSIYLSIFIYLPPSAFLSHPPSLAYHSERERASVCVSVCVVAHIWLTVPVAGERYWKEMHKSHSSSASSSSSFLSLSLSLSLSVSPRQGDLFLVLFLIPSIIMIVMIIIIIVIITRARPPVATSPHAS